MQECTFIDFELLHHMRINNLNVSRPNRKTGSKQKKIIRQQTDKLSKINPNNLL